MVVLGLGSNTNDRLANLRQALLAIKNLSGVTVEQVSPIYLSDALLPENAPASWNLPYLNLAIRCNTTLEPHTLLNQLKDIERILGRKPDHEKWSPRCIDIDILAWDERIITSDTLNIPHPYLLERRFALWPLSDVAPFWQYPLTGTAQSKTAAALVEPWGSRYTSQSICHTKQIEQRIDTPQLVGVINITPDSFSDGGNFLDVDRAVQQAMDLVYAGASILDIGAESTAPSAKPLTSGEEWSRLKPVLTAIHNIKSTFFITPKISLDTRHVDVAEKALSFGIDWINDVTGLDDPAMRDVVLTSGKDCVIMHHLSIPEDRSNVLSRAADPVEIVYAWGKKRLQELVEHGIPAEKIIFDPGIGFGKMAEQSLRLLQQVQTFTSLGTKILIGHSRKTFMANFTSVPPAQRDIETLAISLRLIDSVDFLRVHNVEVMSRMFRTWRTFG